MFTDNADVMAATEPGGRAQARELSARWYGKSQNIIDAELVRLARKVPALGPTS